MKRHIIIALALALAAAPLTTRAEQQGDAIETSAAPVTLRVDGRVVRVTGACGEEMEIFNLTGAKVAVIKLDSADKTLTLNLGKGCYLLKVGKTVRKISIR